jgi:hypothetical protein
MIDDLHRLFDHRRTWLKSALIHLGILLCSAIIGGIFFAVSTNSMLKRDELRISNMQADIDFVENRQAFIMDKLKTIETTAHRLAQIEDLVRQRAARTSQTTPISPNPDSLKEDKQHAR